MTRTITPSLPTWPRLIPLLALVALLAQFVVGQVAAPGAFAAGSVCAVTPNGAAPYPTIQSAVNDPSCATIRLVAGTYYENVTIYRTVTIQGVGANLTTVNGGGQASVFAILRGTVTLDGLTITNGRAWWGGGIYNSGTLTVNNSTISHNVAFQGGGIYNVATVTVNNSTISGNTTTGNNVAPGYGGGGIYNAYGAVTVNNSTIAGNTADYGGGIWNERGTVTVNNSTISGNRAKTAGGGIYNQSVTVTVTDSTISGNFAPTGGGIYNIGTLTVSDSTISGNTAYVGGGIFNQGALYVQTTQLVNNTPNDCVGNGCP